MKTRIIALALVAFSAIAYVSVANSSLGNGNCTKCNCKAFKADPTDENVCINTYQNGPTGGRCQHAKSDHK